MLFIEKQALRDYVEIGEWVEYEVEVRNAGNAPLADVVVEDRLPGGFRYEKKSARLDGHRIDDPDGGAGPRAALRRSARSSRTRTWCSATACWSGPGAAKSGDAINRAQAIAGSLRSNVASARVRLVDGVFSDRGFIVGKVFADCDGDREQDRGEPGVPGVTLFLEDGTNSRTDADGKYNFYGVSPRTHALKVDATSLPDGARLAVLHHRFARRPGEPVRRSEARRAAPRRLRARRLHGAAARRACANARRRSAPRPTSSAETIDRELERQDPQRRRCATCARCRRAAKCRAAPRRSSRPRAGPTRASTRATPNRPPLPVQPSPSVPLEELVPALDPSLGFLDFADGSVLPGDQVNVRVKGRAGT